MQGMKNMKQTRTLTISGLMLFFASMILVGCYHDDAESLYPRSALPGSVGCDTMNVSYSRTVKSIFLNNCALAGCHASSSPTGGYTLDNYNGVKSIVLSGRVTGAITHTMGYSFMPKDRPKLDECQIGLIKSWINQGAQNN